MKKAIILGGLVLTIFALLISGCGENTDTDTTQPSSKPSTVNQDVVPTNVGCGDNICAEDEGCDEVTHRTKCADDCGLTCGPSITFSSPECEGDCSVSGDTVSVKSTSRIKITITNDGEKGTDLISSNFRCDYLEGELYFKTELGDKNGYVWDDYFEGGDEEDMVSSPLSAAGNELVYYLSLDGATQTAREVACRVGFSSTSFNTAQIVRFNLNFR